MKNNCRNFNTIQSGILILVILLLNSCEKETIPAELAGNWKTGTHEITVRYESGNGGFQYTSDTATVKLGIDDNNMASGYIGSAKFENARVKINSGNPDITGIAYIVECGSVNKIFDNDPLDAKQVQIWLGPLNGNTMDAELRYTEGWAHYPMAQLKFTRE